MKLEFNQQRMGSGSGRRVGDRFIGAGALAVLLVAGAACIRAFWLIHGSHGLQNDPAGRASLTWILVLFTGAILCLGVALWYWGSRLRRERAGSVRLHWLSGLIHQLPDALVAVDAEGRVVGSNLKARRLAAGSAPLLGMPAAQVYPFLQHTDIAALLDPDRTQEVAVRATSDREEPIYRVRCYPSGEVHLLLISDITSQARESVHREQEGQQEVIGRIAQGVAHDFNNILCAISGHAALMARSERLNEAEVDSLTTIADEANRGAILARQLVDLSRPLDAESPTADLGTILKRSASLLKKAIGFPGWQVVADVATVELYPEMPQSQLEQLFIRFGLQLTDEYDHAQTLHLLMRRPGTVPLGDVEPACDAVVLVVVSPLDHPPDLRSYQVDESPPLSRDGGGVIQSVVLSLLERHGGSLDILVNEAGYHAYRVCLTQRSDPDEPADAGGPEDDVMETLTGWSVLLARPATLRWSVTHLLLKDMGADIKHVNNVVAALHELEHGRRFHAVFIDESLLGMDPSGTLRKALRFQPEAAFVLLRSGQSRTVPLADQVAPLERPVSLAKLQRTLIKSRRLSLRRSQPATFSG